MWYLKKYISLKVISVIIAVSFFVTSTMVDQVFAGGYPGENLAPQSIFSPLRDNEIHDIAMMEYVVSSALRSGAVDLLTEQQDRTAESLMADLGSEDITITFHFSESIDHMKSGIRLIPCTYSCGQDPSPEGSRYWCSVEGVEGEYPKIIIFTDQEKRTTDIEKRLRASRAHARREARYIQMALESEVEHDERIRRAILNGKYVTIDQTDLTRTLPYIYNFLSVISPRLLGDFHALVKEGRLMVITETSEEGRLLVPHAGNRGIYLPNIQEYVRSDQIIHEIFAKAGFEHTENMVFQDLFRRYLEVINDGRLDRSGEFLEAMNLSFEERRLLDEAQDAAFVLLRDKSSTRDYSADQERKRGFKDVFGEQRIRYADILGEVSTILSATNNVEKELDDIADIVRGGLGLHGVNIGLMEEGRGRLRVAGASTEFNAIIHGLIKRVSFNLRRNDAAIQYFNALDDVQLISFSRLLSLIFAEGTIAKTLLQPLVDRMERSELGQMVIMPIRDEENNKLGAIHMTKMSGEGFSEAEIALVRTLLNNISVGIAKNRSYRRYRDIVESSPDSIVTLNGKGRVTGCNPETEKMMGYSSEEIVGERLNTVGVLRPDDMSRMMQIFSRLMKGKRVEPFEMIFVRKDGARRIGLVRPKILPSGNVQIITTDITDQRRLEKEYKVVVENAKEGMMIIQDSVFKFTNPNWSEISGYSSDELIDMNFLDLIHPEDKEIMRFRHQKRMSGEKTASVYDVRIIDKKRKTKWIRNSIVMHEWEGRSAVLCFSSDITERKKAEEEAGNVARQWEETFNATHEMFAILDIDRNILRVNAAFLDLLGMSQQEVVGKNCCELVHSALHMRPDNCPFGKAREEGKARSSVFFEEKIGRWLEVSVSPIFDSEGQVIQMVHVARDITERYYAGMALKMQRDISLAINSSEKVPEMLDKVLHVAMEINAVDCGGIYILDEGTGQMDLISHQGLGPEFVDEVRRYPSDARKARIVDEGIPLFMSHDDMSLEGGLSAMTKEGLRSLAMLPIKNEDKVVGLMNLSSHTIDEMPPEVRELLEAVISQVGEGIAKRLLSEEKKRSEERYRRLFESMNEGCALHEIILDDEGKPVDYRFIEVNPKFEELTGLKELTGLSRQDIVGKTATEVFPGIENDQVEWIGQYGKVAISGKPIRLEQYSKTMGRWYNISVYSPKKGKFVTVFQDITKRKRTEKALKKRMVALTMPMDDSGEIDLEDLFDLEDIQRLQDQFSAATGVASIITHVDGSPITKPSNFCRLCNDIIRATDKGCANCYRSDAQIGKYNAAGPIVQACLSGGLWDAGAAIMVGGRHIANWLIGQVRDETQNEERIRAYAREIQADEEEAVEAFREVPAMSLEKFKSIAKVLYTLATQLSDSAYQNVQQARFIADRETAQEALLKSEQMYRHLFNWLPVAVVMHNDTGRIVHANLAANDLFGYSGEDFVKLRLDDIDTAGFAAMRENIHEVQDEKGYWTGHGQHRTKAGRVFESDVLTQRLDDGITVSVIHDASARVVSVKSEVIASIMHDWNNAKQGEKLVLPEVCRRAIEDYPKGTVDLTWKELRGLVSSSIQSTQIGEMALDTVKGIDRLHPRKVRLCSIARYLRDQFGMKVLTEGEELQGKDISSVSMLVSDDEFVVVDRKSIERIVNNLVKNALEFSNKGTPVSVTIRKKILDESDFDERFSMPIVEKQGKRNFSEGDEAIEIIVSDQGRGMNDAVQSKLGEVRFTTRDGKGGSGLGISGSLDLVKRLEGDMEVISAEGEGSTFIVRLKPASISDIEKLRLPGPESAGQLKVLIVDDNSAAKKLIEGYLIEGVGIDPLNLYSPATFAEMERVIVEAGPWDVVVLDQNLGGLRSFGAEEELLGTDLISRYRESGVFSEETAVFIDSVTSDPEDIRKVKEIGVPFVNKESGRDAFLEVLSEAFYSARPHLLGKAEYVDLTETAEKDYLDEFMEHAEPGDYLDTTKGFTPEYYSLLSERMHSTNNIIGGFVSIFEVLLSRMAEKDPELKEEVLMNLDLIDNNILPIVERVMSMLPFNREGIPREGIEELSFSQRILVLSCELEAMKKAVEEMKTMSGNFLAEHKYGLDGKYVEMFKLAVNGLDRFNVSGRADGLSFDEALQYAYEASVRLESMEDLLALDDIEIADLDLFREGESVLNFLPDVLAKMRKKRGMFIGKKKTIDLEVEEKANLSEFGSDQVRILIADDEDLIREMMGEFITVIFEEKGYIPERIVIDMVSSGETVLEIVEGKDIGYYDAILIDNDFKEKGDLSGLDVGKALDEMGFDREGKLLLLSSGMSHPGAETWFTGQLRKPMNKKSITEDIVNPLVNLLEGRLKTVSRENDFEDIAQTRIEQVEEKLSDMFDDSPVGLAIFNEYADVTDRNGSFYSIMDELNMPRGESFFQQAKISGEEAAKLGKGEPVFKKTRVDGGEVYLNITSFLGKDNVVFGYMAQMQTVEEYERVQEEARLAAKRLVALNKLSRQERASVLQSASINKVALVYGGDFRKAIRMLGAIGFKGSIVLAKDKEELKKALASGEQFDVLINTSSEDIKNILANLNVSIAVIDDLAGTNNFQNTLLEICA